LEYLLALCRRLPDRKTADREPRKSLLLEPFERCKPERFVHAALDDAEQHALAGLGIPGEAAAFRPAQRKFHRCARRLLGRRIRRALVEDHRDIRTESALDLHRALRVQEYVRAVDWRAESHALLRELPHPGQAEDLVAAGIRENGARPMHEAVQAAMRADYLGTRPQHQVEGIREDDLGAAVDEFLGRDALDRSVGADRHEGRSLDDAAREREPPAARTAVTGQEFELHGRPSRSASAAGSGVTNIASP